MHNLKFRGLRGGVGLGGGGGGAPPHSLLANDTTGGALYSDDCTAIWDLAMAGDFSIEYTLKETWGLGNELFGVLQETSAVAINNYLIMDAGFQPKTSTTMRCWEEGSVSLQPTVASWVVDNTARLDREGDSMKWYVNDAPVLTKTGYSGLTMYPFWTGGQDSVAWQISVLSPSTGVMGYQHEGSFLDIVD